jgi:aminoglycoside phosphotransferase (APT) family kinase protein
VTQSHSVISALLSAIRRDLDAVVAPAIGTPEARRTAAMIGDLLAYLTVWQRDMPGQVGPLTRAQAEALATLPPPGDAEPALPSDIAAPLPEYEAGLRALDAALAAWAPGAARAAAADLLLFDREASLLGAEREQAAARLAAAGIGEARLTAYVREVFPGDTGATVGGLRPVEGLGEGWRLTLTGSAGRARDLVLLRDPSAELGATPVRERFALLRLLASAGFPVPEPVWLEPDPAPLGRPFMLSAAPPTGEDWTEDEETRGEVCLSLARVLGRLHGLDRRVVEAAGLRGEADPRAQVRAHVREWRDRWLRRRAHPSPTLRAAFAWLLDNVPAELPAPAVVHGALDARAVAGGDGRVLALRDWEFAHLGDPSEDLAACRAWAEPLAPWSEFMSAYRSAGGGDLAEENAAYFALWRGVRDAVGAALAWRAFLDGDAPALAAAHRGIPVYRRHLRETAERLRRLAEPDAPGT